ncbi:MAG: hypothetical protein ACI3XE_04265 [Eubacteriales bacterium]
MNQLLFAFSRHLLLAGGAGDALKAFFGYLIGRPVSGASVWQTVLGGVMVIGGFLVVFLLAALILYRVKMPLPPEERDGSSEGEREEPGEGSDERADEESKARPETTETPDNSEEQDKETPHDTASL